MLRFCLGAFLAVVEKNTGMSFLDPAVALTASAAAVFSLDFVGRFEGCVALLMLARMVVCLKSVAEEPIYHVGVFVLLFNLICDLPDSAVEIAPIIHLWFSLEVPRFLKMIKLQSPQEKWLTWLHAFWYLKIHMVVLYPFLNYRAEHLHPTYQITISLLFLDRIYQAAYIAKEFFAECFTAEIYKDLECVLPPLLHIAFLGQDEVVGMAMALIAFVDISTDPGSTANLLSFIASSFLMHSVLIYRIYLIIPKLFMSSLFVNLILLSHRVWFYYSIREITSVVPMLTGIVVVWDFALINFAAAVGDVACAKMDLLHYATHIVLACAIYKTNCFNCMTRTALHALFVLNVWTFRLMQQGASNQLFTV